MASSEKTLKIVTDDIVPIEWADLNTAYLLQSSAWVRVKTQFGWEPFAFRQTRHKALHQDLLVLLQKIWGFGYVGYVPDGLLQSNTLTAYTAHSYQTARECAFYLLCDVMQFIRMHYGKNVVCLRWDAPWCVNVEDAKEFLPELYESARRTRCVYTCARGNVYGCTYVQPPATVFVDLRKSEEEMLKAMKAKTRYNIRLAEKRGVSICKGISIDAFYTLYQVTSKRNGIAIHSKEYYAAVFDSLRAERNSEVIMYGAYYKGKLIAASMVSYYGSDVHAESGALKEACYLYGATANEHRNLMPMYLLQWQAICDARSNACVRYDLFGIPLNQGGKSSMQGLYRFKMGFGGTVCLRGGGFACVSTGFFAFIWYTLFQIAERVFMRMLRLCSWLRGATGRRRTAHT